MTPNTKKIVVIGGTSGMGYAVAERAAKDGAHVVVASRDQERVDAAASRLPGTSEGRRIDVTDEASIAAFFAGLGEFDHLVHTAGDTLLLKGIEELTSAEARAAFEVRYWGAFLAVRHALPGIRPGGSIVLTSGVAATRPLPGSPIPASTTGAIESLTRALALDLAPRGIRVNAVRPGVVRTELWDGLVPEPETFFRSQGSALPAGRVGRPEDAAAAYLFLLDNPFATGTVLTLDGGGSIV
ncbi:SDR family oxidoreductase [Kitasatospora sp. NPDC094015]|uniref:SDR family oxidoreductase n=1 Tax=Kitasatospora sp. NPDC094015 TaxID=3155205 RepID=UPI00331ED365